GGMLAASAISSMLGHGSSPFGAPDGAGAGAEQAASHGDQLPAENHVQQANYQADESQADEGDFGGGDDGGDSWI
ncbi:MAG TPA: DUF2076 domain-containing protein, partial [Azospirillum sp.]